MSDVPSLWSPHDGPQRAFLAAEEDEVLYGGAKGGGKSDAILFGAFRQTNKPRYKALILRETFKELNEMLLRAHLVVPRLRVPGVWREKDSSYTFPSGAKVTFGHCANIKDAQLYQGGEWAYIGFDELGNIADENVWTELLKEIRCPDPTVRRMARASANPGYSGEPWLIARFVKPCGEDGRNIARFPLEIPNHGTVTLTRRFVPARVTDNPVYANDPVYLATLHALPYRRRMQLLEGKWGLGGGRALDELDPIRHIVPPFEIPAHWTKFSAFDWGFAHPFAFGAFACDAFGTIYLVDSVHGHRMLPWEQAERVQSKIAAEYLRLTYAGSDTTSEHRARGENTPTIAEHFRQYGVLITEANQARKFGLNNFREYIKWRGANGEQAFIPKFFMFDTPGNRETFACLERMTTDPKDQEDALKVDANADGENGDDAYDMCRYGLAARPLVARAPVEFIKSAWEPSVLEHEANEGRIVREKLDKAKGKRANVDILGGW